MVKLWTYQETEDFVERCADKYRNKEKLLNYLDRKLSICPASLEESDKEGRLKLLTNLIGAKLYLANKKIEVKKTKPKMDENGEKVKGPMRVIREDFLRELSGWVQANYLIYHIYFLVVRYYRWFSNESKNRVVIGDSLVEKTELMRELIGELQIAVNAYQVVSICHGILKSPQTDSKEALKSFAKSFIESLSQLFREEECLEVCFPCGTACHAIYLYFTKFRDGRILIRIDNVGAFATEEHKGTNSDGGKYYFPFLIGEMSTKDLENANCCKVLARYLTSICLLQKVDKKKFNDGDFQTEQLKAFYQKAEKLQSQLSFDKNKNDSNPFPAFPAQPEDTGMCVVENYQVGFFYRSKDSQEIIPSEFFNWLLLKEAQYQLSDYTTNQPRLFFFSARGQSRDPISPKPPESESLIPDYYGLLAGRREYNRPVSSATRKKLTRDWFVKKTELSWINIPAVNTCEYVKNEDRSEDHERVGRSAIIKSLYDKFSSKGVGVHFGLLYGLSGSGKTTTATWYAENFQGKYYDVVFWFNAARSSTLKEQFEKFAKDFFDCENVIDKNIDIAASLFSSLMKSDKCRFLIVFDGVKHPKYIEEFLPLKDDVKNGKTMHCLITSRYSGWGSCEKVNVTGFSDKELEAFLATFPREQWEKNREACLEVAKMVDCHPLALSQIKEYLNRNETRTILDCKNLLEMKPKELFKKVGVREAILTSMTFSINEFIEDAGDMVCKKSARFAIQVMAFLPLTKFPKFLLEEIICVFFQEINHDVSQSSEDANKKSIEMAKKIIDKMANFSLLIQTSSDDMVEVYALLQKMMKRKRYKSAYDEYVNIDVTSIMLKVFDKLFIYHYLQQKKLDSKIMLFLPLLELFLKARISTYSLQKNHALQLYVKLANYYYYENYDFNRAESYYALARSLVSSGVTIDKGALSELHNNYVSLLISLERFSGDEEKKFLLDQISDVVNMNNSEELSQVLHKVYALSNQGRLFKEHNQWNDAEKSYGEAEKLLDGLREPVDNGRVNPDLKKWFFHTRSFLANNQTDLYFAMNRFEKDNSAKIIAREAGINYARNSLYYKRKICHEPRLELYTAIYNVAELCSENEKFPMARDYYKEALDVIKAVFDKRSVNYVDSYYKCWICEKELRENSDSTLNKIREIFRSYEDEINARDYSGATFIEMAVRAGDLDGVKLLLKEYKVDATVCNIDSETIFLQAVSAGHVSIIRCLHEMALGDINESNGMGYSAIWLAVWNGRKEAVEYLLSEGATLEDRGGRNIFELANQVKQPEILVILKEHQARKDNENKLKTHCTLM